MNFFFLDSIDEEVVEISDNEMEVEDDDELALIPSSSRTGMPSMPSPIKAVLVLFYFTSFIILYLVLYFQWEKTLCLLHGELGQGNNHRPRVCVFELYFTSVLASINDYLEQF